MNLGQDFVLTLFTNNPAIAKQADEAGVNRIGLDLERLGKESRQSNRCWISDHKIEEFAAIIPELSHAQLFARTNPIYYSNLKSEIDICIEMGVKVIMLPMFESAADASQFVEWVAGRAKVYLLVETPAAAMRIHDIVRVDGVDEIHVGLNDMYLGMQLKSHFEVLVSDLMDMLANVVHEAGIPFGFGGIARLDDKNLPIPADLVYAEYARLNATRALVSRVFFQPDPKQIDMTQEIKIFRERLNFWVAAGREKIDLAHKELRQLVTTQCFHPVKPTRNFAAA
jgi:hypothetical protein